MVDRRHFLRIMTSASGGLLVGVTFSCRSESRGAEFAAEDSWFTPNAFVEVSRSGRIRIAAPVPEVGQGVSAALPNLVASELRVPLDSVEVWRPAADDRFGGMVVAGSDAVASYWEPLRRAGAAAREVLLAAAAQTWQVPVSECTAQEGYILHAGGRRAPYGEFVELAATLPVPTELSLSDWPAQGPASASRDPEIEKVIRGTAIFGIDVRRPDMLYAAVLRPPIFGARLRSFQPERALSSPGVLSVVAIEPVVPDGAWYGAVRGGVAVIATSTWAAITGRSLVAAEWEGEAAGPSSSEELFAALRARAGSAPERLVRRAGDVPTAADWIERWYELPLLAHGCMEPTNFTARISADGYEAWGPTQNPRSLQALAGAALGVDRELVTIHPTRVGGGFGRRLAVDYGVEAFMVARHTDGRPVQVVWTREDDIQYDYYRPPSVHRVRAQVDRSGRIRAWEHHVATSSLARASFGPGAQFPAIYDVQGADDFPLDPDYIQLGHSSVEVPLQLGSLRSVAHSFNVFAVQSFLDELAYTGGHDALEFRRNAIGPDRRVEIAIDLPGRRGNVAVDTARLRRVLDTVAAAGPWMAGGRRGELAQGIAFALYKGTYVAHLAEVVRGPSVPRVQRVVVAIDCGTIVDQDGVRAQAEGAVIDGISTVFHWAVPYRDGRVTVSNFSDYRLSRAAEAPSVEVHLVPGGGSPTGMGEPPYPSVVPAIATAIGRLYGKPVRRLPWSASGAGAP